MGRFCLICLQYMQDICRYCIHYSYNINTLKEITNKQVRKFDINVQYYFRSVRSTIITIFLAVTVVVVMIYLVAKIWPKYKQRRNLMVIAPLNIVHHPYLNNLKFNPIIVKSITFYFHCISPLIIIIVYFTLYKLKLVRMYPKYNEVQVLFISLHFSIVLPLTIYWKNPSLRKYLQNNFLSSNSCGCDDLPLHSNSPSQYSRPSIIHI